MGCVEGRTISPQENSLTYAQQGLGFHLLQAQTVDTTIRKHSTAGQINYTQLQKISDTLQIQITSNYTHQKIATLFRRLKLQQNFFLSRDLLSLGILLSKGSKQQKAQLLFQVFDQENVGYIAIQKLTQGLTLLIALSLQFLSCLVYNGQSEFANQSRIFKYIQALSQAKDTAISRLTTKLPKRNQRVSMTHFIQEIKNSKYDLVTPIGWRQYLLELYNARPPKQAGNQSRNRQKDNLN